MGLLFSCCRHRTRRDREREPLLPKHRVAQAIDHTTPSQTQLNKIADIFAALKTGKLPAEQQIERSLYRLLKSDLFDLGHERDQSLSPAGSQLINEVEEVLEALLHFLQEKNSTLYVQVLSTTSDCSQVTIFYRSCCSSTEK